MQTTVKKTVVRWPYLVLGIITMFVTGIIYAWSILKAPFAETFMWNAPDLALNFTLTMCFFCIGGIVAGQMTSRIGVKIPGICGGVLACLGFVLTSTIDGSSILVLYIAYGVLGGLGIGMIYNIIVTIVGAWYTDKKGFCTGCLMMCFGISTLVLGKVANYFIQAGEWRQLFVTFGIIIGVIAIIVGFLLRVPRSDEIISKKTTDDQKSQENLGFKDFTTVEMLKRFSFWRAFVWLICLIAVGASVVSFAKDLAIAVGASDTLATTLVGVFSICNGLGRIVFGALFDAVGRKKTMLIANVMAILAAGILFASLQISSIVLCTVGLCMTGLAYGSGPTLTSVFTSAFYGEKYFRSNYSIMNLDIMAASFVATIASSLFVRFGTYSVSFLLLLILTIVSLFLNLSLQRP